MVLWTTHGAALHVSGAPSPGKLTSGFSQVSVWNLVRYNVIGGGQSALYGTEGPLYYARNLFNAFNLAVVLAPIAPLVRSRRMNCSTLHIA